MKIDIVFFNDEMLISKISADWKIWQSKLFYYKSSLSFENTVELIEYLRVEYKLVENELQKIKDSLFEPNSEMFLVNLSGKENNIIEIIKTSNILKEKNELIYWDEWNWSFSKQKDDYFLWVYVGGIADICREIKLSISQNQNFTEKGKPYIVKLASEIAEFNSEKYKEAINENRRII
ncbi:hypothetical protein SAMN05660845_2520 [Flavobacterium swingsii]|uniref:Uncharacterized protein n=1 Tax=Flavobacterium swingsii TaxID=498292 RepID=A0A1I0ZYV9_9FLAO|nr:hypothetical protein [Flavobacterium swingsii]SFB30925.1 hypothetical protein SAMN05660845_2520 [Flavobacterium swingsii]